MIQDMLENPRCFGIGKLRPRTTSWPSKQLILPEEAFLYEIDDWRLCLNGSWRFCWSPTLPPEEPFFACDYDDAAWELFPVPAHWELNGYGTPIYTNYTYTFAAEPPHVMALPPEEWTSFVERNPTGRYRRRFELPQDWHGRRQVLYFGGVSGAFRLWVNGVFIGYSEDSMGVAQFDVTDVVHEGENLIALEVYKYCSGSYLEDQDCWRLGGIFRDVFLYSTASVFVEDCVVGSRIDERALTVDVSVGGDWRGCRIEAISGDLHSEVLCRSAENQLKLSFPGCIDLWSAELPHLYPVTVVLRRDETILDIRHYRTGFRSVEVRGRELFLNGRSIKLHGVNRHEFDPENGRVVSPDLMRLDVSLIKNANFDAVRSSHYPNHPLWYELCDRYGLYVLDEANVESHGLSYHKCVLPGDDPEWTLAVIDRVERMVRTNRNHVSIILWSPGNEAGYGDAFEAAAKEIARLDCRPTQYADMNRPMSFESQTYPPPEWLERYTRNQAERKGEQGQLSTARQHGTEVGKKPFLMNEYAHAMGNSTGNFREYWEMIDRHPCLIGGFVWEFCEHGLYQECEYGMRFACGGDFGDVPNDGNFCWDGLFRADREANPGLEEVRFIQQPLVVESKEVRNRFAFTAIDSIGWILLADGVPIADGFWKKRLEPGERFSPPLPEFPADRECFLRLRAFEGELEVAECEMALNAAVIYGALPSANPLWRSCAVGNVATLPEMFFATPPEALLTRAFTDNDRGCAFPERSAFWSTEKGRDSASIEISEAGEGRWRLRLLFQPPDEAPEVARLGVRFRLPEVWHLARWYGRGPHECYCDRKSSALVGRYEAEVDQLSTPYSRPQENGQRCDVRELELEAYDGSLLRFTSATLFGFTLRTYSAEALAAATHDNELPYGDCCELILDYAQRGVGGDDSWHADVHEAYRIVPQRITADFMIELHPSEV